MCKRINRNEPGNGWAFIYWLLFIITVSVIMVSCSTTSKIKSISKTTVDSSSVVKSDSSGLKTTDSVSVKKDNTVTVTETDGAYTKETIFEFADPETDSGSTVKYLVPADDYFPVIKPAILKKITIKETGIVKTKQTTAANTIDSNRVTTTEAATVKKEAVTDVKKTVVTKDKAVKRTSCWGWLWMGIIAAAVFAVGWYFGWWPWLIAFIRRTRKKEQYPIKYKKT